MSSIDIGIHNIIRLEATPNESEHNAWINLEIFAESRRHPRHEEKTEMTLWFEDRHQMYAFAAAIEKIWGVTEDEIAF